MSMLYKAHASWYDRMYRRFALNSNSLGVELLLITSITHKTFYFDHTLVISRELFSCTKDRITEKCVIFYPQQPGAWNCYQFISHVNHSPKHLTSSAAFPYLLAGSQLGSEAAETQTGSQKRCWCQRSIFTSVPKC